MLYKCVHRKFGTILYQKGIDPLFSLSWALGTNNSCDNISMYTTPTIKPPHQILPEAAYVVNDLIHEEAKRQATVSREHPLTFNIDKSINPLLVQFINYITLSTRERKHSSLGRMSDSSQHLKKVRMYNIISLLLYATNLTQPLLIHDLKADVVKMCGGSRELLRLLNRLVHLIHMTIFLPNMRIMREHKIFGINCHHMFLRLLQLITLELFSCLLW